MSNLNLPSMHPVALAKFMNGKSARTLAYATTVNADKDSDGRITYSIRHHGHLIATVSDWSVSISNCGYHSRTTSARITAVLNDNHIPYYVAVRGGIHALFQRKAEVHSKVTPYFHDAWFIMRAGQWVIADR